MIIYVACDIWGIKDNLKLEFASPPQTISHLTDRIEAAYQAEVIRLAPPDVDRQSIPRFVVECITLLVDDSIWVELYALKQLFNRCQLFVFQPRSAFHSDARGIVPPPREPIIGSAPALPGVLEPLALPQLDVAHITFKRLDKNGEHKVRVAELKAALVMLGFRTPQLPPEVAGRQYLDFQAWLHFVHAHPQIAEAIVRVGTVDPAAFQSANQPRVGGRGQQQSGFVSPGRYPAATMAPPVGAAALLSSAVSARDMSPPRRQVSKTEQQRIVNERLSGGLSATITARDRQPDVAYEAYSHLLSQGSPGRRRPASPGSSSGGRRPTTPQLQRWK